MTTTTDGGSSTNEPVVWIDGSLRTGGDATLHWSDHGITVGDGVFETVKIVGAEPFALAPHLDRLARSAEGLGLVPPARSTIEAAVAEVADTWAATAGAEALGRLRLTATAGPGPTGSERGAAPMTLMVTVSDLVMTRDPTPVVVVPWTRNETGALAGLKTTSYAENVVALARAHAASASEAIFANTRGELCEGTGTNVFVARAGRLITPPLGSGCLDGITRRLLLDALGNADVEVAEETLPLSALATASEAFLTSTTREVQPIAMVDDIPLTEAPGPLTLIAQEAWDARYG